MFCEVRVASIGSGGPALMFIHLFTRIRKLSLDFFDYGDIGQEI